MQTGVEICKIERTELWHLEESWNGGRQIWSGPRLALHTEDQLLISGDELNGAPIDRFWVAGVPFPFSGNALLVGIDPSTGDTANQPVMAIDEFRRLAMFAESVKGWHRPPVLLVGLGGDDFRGGC